MLSPQQQAAAFAAAVAAVNAADFGKRELQLLQLVGGVYYSCGGYGQLERG